MLGNVGDKMLDTHAIQEGRVIDVRIGFTGVTRVRDAYAPDNYQLTANARQTSVTYALELHPILVSGRNLLVSAYPIIVNSG